MTATTIRPALDIDALALHYRVPVSTLRDWARQDGWRRYPDPALRNRRGRPRVLFDVADVDNSYWARRGSHHTVFARRSESV